MFRFVHAADVHLDSPLRGLERYDGAPVETIRGAARRELENLVTLAVEEDVGLVLLAGDLYDGDWKDYNTGLFLMSQVVRLKEAGIPVVAISGNHDAASQITKHLTSLPENLTWLGSRQAESVVFEALGAAVHGQSYPTRAVTTDLSPGYPEPVPGMWNIGLLHTSVTGREGHEAYAPCTVEGLRARGYDYWALGHVHQREVLSEAPWIVFPGNIQGRHARETGPKGCTLVTVEDGAVTAIEHRDLHALRWAVCAVDADGARDGDEVLERVAEALGASLDAMGEQTLAVRVVVTGACGAHGELSLEPERWRSEIRAKALDLGGGRIWVEKIRLATRAAVDVAAAAARDDALGGLLRAIAGLQADERQLGELLALFDDLRTKLPRELRAGDDPLDMERPESLRAALEDAKELLLARLLADGGQR